MNFNLTAYELALIAGGFTILGALIGNWISHRFSDYRDRRKEFNEAADTFRDAFISELSAIRNRSFSETIDNVDPCELLRNAFDKHRTAYEVFRLRLDRQSEFDKAWRNYFAYDDTDEDTYEHLVKYSPIYTGNVKKECRTLAITNIEKLLEFAKHK